MRPFSRGYSGFSKIFKPHIQQSRLTGNSSLTADRLPESRTKLQEIIEAAAILIYSSLKALMPSECPPFPYLQP